MILTPGESVFSGTKGSLKYRFRRGSSDRQHLLVIFSGFRAKGTLDFGGGALDPIRHNVLWIYDEFGEEESICYYMAEAGSNRPADTVDEFLTQVREELHLSPENTAYAGFSKGGSAALYFGLRHRVGAIVSTVPQFFVGNYVRQNWPQVFDFMRAGQDADAEQKALDSLMPALLDNSTDVPTHVYLFSSPSDHQLEEEIKPMLGKLKSLLNFNLLISESPLITQHNEVTAYNVPGLLGLFQLVADGIYPVLGEVTSKVSSSAELAAAQRRFRQGVAVAENISFEKGRLDMSLATFIRGVAQPDFSSMTREVQVRPVAGGEPVILHLGKKIDESISRRYLQDTFIDYRAAASTSPHGAGYSLDAFPDGESTLHVKMMGKSASAPVEAPLTTRAVHRRQFVDGDTLLVWDSDTEGTKVTKSKLSELPADKFSFVQIDKFELLEGQKVQLAGWFAPMGTVLQDWGSASYYLHLANENHSYSFKLGMLDRSVLLDEVGLPASMGKAYFADIQNSGVDLSTVVSGEYRASIFCINADVVARSKEIGTVTVGGVEEEQPLPEVSVLGSCITRDIFNSNFIEDHRNRNILTSASHQSALVSLASAPYTASEPDFSDLDSHSLKCTEEDISKSVVDELVKNPPAYMLVDLFSDARFGVKDIDGVYVTDNAWKIATSKAYKDFKDYPTLSMHKNKEEYLELFKKSALDLHERVEESAGREVPFVLVKVRATETLRAKDGEVQLQPGAARILNEAFVELEKALVEVLPSTVVVDMTDYNAWANKEHLWSAYAVHYEQAFYEELDRRVRDLLGTSRSVKIQKSI